MEETLVFSLVLVLFVHLYHAYCAGIEFSGVFLCHRIYQNNVGYIKIMIGNSYIFSGNFWQLFPGPN